MTHLSQKDFDALPSTFTLKTARQDLRWQGSGVGLARLLLDNGFAATEPRQGKKRLWIRLESAADHSRRIARQRRAIFDPFNIDGSARTAGATDQQGSPEADMAERTLRLVTILRPMSTDMIDRLDELVQRSGPANARAYLANFSPDDGVPF